MPELTSIDKIFGLIIDEAAAREDLCFELNVIKVILEIMDKYRTVTEDQDLVVIQHGHDIKWRLKLCARERKHEKTIFGDSVYPGIYR